MADPKDTLIVLDRLEALGFDDKAFQALHHFRQGGRSTTIARHRAYCEKTRQFDDGSENERTQTRLKSVLAAYVQGGFTSPAALRYSLKRLSRPFQRPRARGQTGRIRSALDIYLARQQQA
jgi:hypothetical protein